MYDAVRVCSLVFGGIDYFGSDRLLVRIPTTAAPLQAAGLGASRGLRLRLGD